MEANLGLIRFANGQPVKREQIQVLLRMAAQATGQDPNRMGTHSLRIGGATALYHSQKDLQYVRRFGRWCSDAFHLYLWESHEQQKGVSSSMAADASSLRVPREAAPAQRRRVHFA